MIDFTGCADAGYPALRCMLVVNFLIDYNTIGCTFHRTIPDWTARCMWTNRSDTSQCRAGSGKRQTSSTLSVVTWNYLQWI